MADPAERSERRATAVVYGDVRADVGVAGDLRYGLDASLVERPDRRGGLVIEG
jgi:hypothetical protein